MPLAASVRALSTMDMPNATEIDATVVKIGTLDVKRFNDANEPQEKLNKLLIDLVNRAETMIIQLLKDELKVRGLKPLTQ